MPKSNLITHSKLIELLHYDPLIGIFTWKISPCLKIKIGDIAGTDNHGYIIIGIKGERYLAHRLAWFYYYGYWPENEIDHIDRIKHHNWISNLRETSHSCNTKNTNLRVDNTSGAKGVYLDKSSNKWRAGIMVNQKAYYLGVFKDFDEAVCHRLAAEQCLGWEGCDSSSLTYLYVKNNIQGVFYAN